MLLARPTPSRRVHQPSNLSHGTPPSILLRLALTGLHPLLSLLMLQLGSQSTSAQLHGLQHPTAPASPHGHSTQLRLRQPPPLLATGLVTTGSLTRSRPMPPSSSRSRTVPLSSSSTLNTGATRHRRCKPSPPVPQAQLGTTTAPIRPSTQ
jgi:hypothetical protein